MRSLFALTNRVAKRSYPQPTFYRPVSAAEARSSTSTEVNPARTEPAQAVDYARRQAPKNARRRPGIGPDQRSPSAIYPGLGGRMTPAARGLPATTWYSESRLVETGQPQSNGRRDWLALLRSSAWALTTTERRRDGFDHDAYADLAVLLDGTEDPGLRAPMITRSLTVGWRSRQPCHCRREDVIDRDVADLRGSPINTPAR